MTLVTVERAGETIMASPANRDRALIHKKACEVYVWEDLLEEYVQKRNHADRTKLQEVREDRDEFIVELADRNREIVKLKMMNKVLQLALASTAPVAAMIVVTSAWVGK
ncbi:hypothetical protein D1007_39408 [Hordeum vulgare]|nr:hypothetical protein D1007_39408 [Hordeum vulgare]